MKKLLFCLVGFLILCPVFSQSQPLKLRVGLSATGTFDEGLWHFKANQGLEPQVFKFENSWGVAMDIDYHIKEKWTAGIHMSFAITGFQLTIQNNNFRTISKVNTSHNQLIGEIKYVARPGKAFRPFVGANAGILLTWDIQLLIGGENIDFKFINPFIYGMVIGFDYEIGSKGWAVHSVIRGQTFEYTTEETSVTNRQRLLDQVWWMNYNHLQFGISKSF